MRLLQCTVATMALGLATTAAADAPALERVKTGIHPDGGFYSLYSLDCGNNAVASVARFEDRSRWCIGQAGQLECTRDAREAWERACRGQEVAGSHASSTANSAGADADS